MSAKTKRKKSTPRARSSKGRMTAKGREIVASLQELLDVVRAGVPLESRFTVRTVEMPDDPRPYDEAAVRATRDLLGVSQPVFAHLVGVSAMLVRAWEQGQRTAKRSAPLLLSLSPPSTSGP